MTTICLLTTSMLIAAPGPANKNSLVGEWVMPKNPNVRFFEKDSDGKQSPVATSAALLQVRREQGSLLRVEAFGIECWVERSDCVTRAEAVEHFSDALKKNAEDAWYWCMRGNARRNVGQAQEAIRDHDQAIALSPRTAVHYSNRGLARKDLAQYQQAIDDFCEAIRLQPANIDAFQERGLCRGMLREFEKAVADFDEVIRLNPKHFWGYIERGNAQRARGKNQEARKDYETALRLRPRTAVTLNNLGCVFQSDGDSERALKMYADAIAADANYALAYFNRGALRNYQNEYEAAIVDLNEAIRLDPKHAEAYFQRGYAHHCKGTAEAALNDYGQTIQLVPNHFSAHYNIGMIRADQGKNKEAISCFDAALRIKADSADSFEYRGRCWIQLKEYDKGLRDLTKAAELNPVFLNTLIEFAFHWSMLDDDVSVHGKRALLFASKACELSKWKKGACLDAVAAAFAQTGQFDEAIKYQKKALEDLNFDSRNGLAARGRLSLYKLKVPYRP